MAKWIETSDKLPEGGKYVLVEYMAGDFDKAEFFDINKDWWKRNIKRWLDESEDNTPSFTIAQMEDAFLEGKGGYYDFKQYMKEEYNIELPD